MGISTALLLKNLNTMHRGVTMHRGNTMHRGVTRQPLKSVRYYITT
jgi:hypothetical protein